MGLGGVRREFLAILVGGVFVDGLAGYCGISIRIGSIRLLIFRCILFLLYFSYVFKRANWF